MGVRFSTFLKNITSFSKKIKFNVSTKTVDERIYFAPILKKTFCIRFRRFWEKIKKIWKQIPKKNRKQICRHFFVKYIFFLKMFWNVSDFFLSKSAEIFYPYPPWVKNYTPINSDYGGIFTPIIESIPPSSFRIKPLHPLSGAPPPDPACFGIETQVNWFSGIKGHPDDANWVVVLILVASNFQNIDRWFVDSENCMRLVSKQWFKLHCVNGALLVNVSESLPISDFFKKYQL